MPIAKTITYENLEEKHKENPKILPFKYIKPFKQEIEELEEDKEVSAPNGPPFMWEEFLQEKKNGFKGTYQDYLDQIDRSPLDFAKKKREWWEAISEEDKGPWDKPQKPWWENLDNEEKKRVGIMRVVSAKDDKDYLKMILSRYYTPNELFGKTIKELNKLLELHMNIQGGLI